jgi:peptide/nickel transport system ATP-binding protein
MNAEKSETIIEVKNLKMYFPITHGILRRKVGDIRAVDDVSFQVRRHETLGLVGGKRLWQDYYRTLHT